MTRSTIRNMLFVAIAAIEQEVIVDATAISFFIFSLHASDTHRQFDTRSVKTE